jgi:P-type Cu+ transporter
MEVTNFDMLRRNDEGCPWTALAIAMSKALEDASTHPIATAISIHCETILEGFDKLAVTASDIREVPGSGMKSTFTINFRGDDEETVYQATLGNQRFYAPKDHAYCASLLEKYQTLGQSVAILAIRPANSDEPFQPLALFAITDSLRPTTASVLHTLQHNHSLSIHMCTGDNAATARSIAQQVGIPIANVRAGVLPHEKAEYIKTLQGSSSRRKIVAFVGDGTNDTPALAAADVGIALSSTSDVAITQGSFILLNSDLETILKLVKFAMRVFWRVKMNFVWAAVYNVCLVPVAAGVFFAVGQWRLGPVWASAAMAASSVSVVCSSLALRLPEVEVGGWKWWKGKGRGSEKGSTGSLAKRSLWSSCLIRQHRYQVEVDQSSFLTSKSYSPKCGINLLLTKSSTSCSSTPNANTFGSGISFDPYIPISLYNWNMMSRSGTPVDGRTV